MKKLMEFKAHHKQHIYLGELDGTIKIIQGGLLPCHQGAQGWFLRCLIHLCSLHFQVRDLSDLHLKILKSILAWLRLEDHEKSNGCDS